MTSMVNSTLLGLELGALQSFENLAVFPLLYPKNGGPNYITLREALDAHVFAVTEVSEGGSVPELKVENSGEVAVLLLDGEELAGAKQNRILNTTILVAAKTAIKVPVSCTEHGRWSYVSREFAESGNIMSPNLRRGHMESVNLNLQRTREYRSDQGRVWHAIAKLHDDLGVKSPTGAMRSVYEAKAADLEAYLKEFRAVERQKGMVVFIKGVAVGMDFVSKEHAFGILFPKLLRSYAMEAVLEARHEGADHSKKAKPDAKGKDGRKAGAGKKAWPAPDGDAAKAFLTRATTCDEKAYESVGEGWSYRYTAKDVVGSALAVDGSVVHAAFFRMEENGSDQGKGDPMADFGSRRRFRL